ncbi:hypothetical protein EVAR_87312_1 [Eumeta japonica]|uniref:Uncharacterized protein n=1 Tax=Eumeta variegata TaxID=151549 RepID=A0A4C1VX52_EUMVA|nr:hypothetical protein EVAR_87312_1 [Eumeta japonica]
MKIRQDQFYAYLKLVRPTKRSEQYRMRTKVLLLLLVACTLCAALPTDEPAPCQFSWTNDSSNTTYSCKTTGSKCIPKYPESYVSGESLVPTLMIEKDGWNCDLCLPSCCEAGTVNPPPTGSDSVKCEDFIQTFGFHVARPTPPRCPELVERNGTRYLCAPTDSACRPEYSHVQYHFLVKYMSHSSILHEQSVCTLCLPSCCREIPSEFNSDAPASDTCMDYVELLDLEVAEEPAVTNWIRRTPHDLTFVAPIRPYYRIRSLNVKDDGGKEFSCLVEIINERPNLDLEKAYDRVKEIIYREPYPCKHLIQALQPLYRGSSAFVKINGASIDWFDILRGVR